MKLADFQKITQILAREHRITIQEGQRWAADIKNRVVFYKKDDIHNLPEEHILGFILHEISHIHYTTLPVITDPHKELKHNTMNLLEDISIEHLISKDYTNAGEILEGTRMEVLDTLIRILPKMEASLFEKSLLYAAARFHGRGYTLGLNQYENIGTEISKIMLKNEDKILNRKQTNDLMPLVEEIIAVLIAKLGEPTEEEKQNMSNEVGGQTNATRAEVHAQREVLKALKAGSGWMESPSISHNMEMINEIVDQTSMVGKKIRSTLKRNNAMEFGGRFRSGKLLAKRLVTTFISKTRNPFARRITKSNQSYAFAIASDVSGSMFNDNEDANCALSSLVMVGEALRMANIPRSITLFGGRTNTVIPMSKKEFRWEDVAGTKIIDKADTGSTNIHLAVDECVKQLDTVRAERKILLILTDGGSDKSALEESYKKAQRQNIECLAITIDNSGRNAKYLLMSEVFSEKNNVQISSRDHADIGNAFIRILKETITASS